MKIIDVEQGSSEWLSWRKTVITATDCSAITGSSPWVTAYKCWQKKRGLIEEQQTNEAMERGKRLEPIARERFIRKYGINMTPVVVESTEYEFLGASLDGISDCRNFILEIKTGGYKLMQMAQQGIVPEYYMDQMQHQMLVTGAQKAFYHVAHEDEEKDIVIVVEADSEFINRFMSKAKEFWRCVAYDQPPELQASDYRDMSGESKWDSYSTQYYRLCEQIKVLEEIKDICRKELITMCEDQSCTGNGIKVIKTIVKGRVDYESIPEIKGVDLEKHRKSSTITWKILLD